RCILQRLRLYPTSDGSGIHIPLPVEDCAVHEFGRLGDVVFPPHLFRSWERMNSLLLFDLPTVIGIGYALSVGVSVKNEGGAVADLRERREHAEIPDRRRQNVFAST